MKTIKKLPKEKNPLLRLLKILFKENKFKLFVLFFITFINAIGAIAISLFFQRVIDDVIMPGVINGYSSVQNKFISLLIFMGSTYIILTLASLLNAQLIAGLSNNFEYRLRKKIFDHMELLPISYFDKSKRGKIMSVYTNDIETLREVVNNVIPEVFTAAISLTGIVAVMLYYSIYFTFLALLSLVFIFVFTRGITKKIKKDFISSISHELRTPLTSIKGWGETLLLDAEENDDLNMGLSIICAEAERLGNIVEELLDFSRLESNAMKVFKDWISPKKILQEVYNQFLPRKGSLEFKCELKGKDSLIYADKNRLKQIFINLIANSMKFTPHGSIFVSAEGFDDRVVFEICDTGIGIAKTDLEKVRERFYKVNINAPGSGMGLSIVEEILKLHDATMEIYSEVGEGTTVKIIFPIKNASYS